MDRRRYLRWIPILSGISGSFLLTMAVHSLSIKIIWWTISFISLILAVMLSLTSRACGHGFVAQGKFGFFWPFVVRRCPTCGAIEPLNDD